MQATGTLSPEQKHVLGSTFHFIESAEVYFRSVIPVVGETDERLLKALVDLADSCLRNLALFFPELRTLEEEHKKRGGQ